MATKKAHVNTPEEKKAIRKTLVAVSLILGILILAVVIIFTVFLSPAESDDSSSNRALWLSVIGGSKWSYSDSTVDEYLMPAFLKNCTYISFGASPVIDSLGTYVFKANFVSSDSTAVGSLRFDSTSSGTLIFGNKSYLVKFSDMSSKSFDSNMYLMRIYVDSAVVDFFLAL